MLTHDNQALSFHGHVLIVGTEILIAMCWLFIWHMIDLCLVREEMVAVPKCAPTPILFILITTINHFVIIKVKVKVFGL